MNKELDLITIGETMVIFDPVSEGPLRYVNQFNKRFGGAESNVAIGLARLGQSVGWMSKIGEDELGQYLVNSIRGAGVDTSEVIVDSSASTGLYIKERIRDNNHVYYYRNGSAASLLKPSDLNWDYIKQAKIIHLTGITPFLSETCYEVVQEVIRFAKDNNILISFDPNIRKKLMNDVTEGKKIILDLAKQADIFLPGRDEAKFLIETDDINEIKDYFFQSGVKYLAIKDGANGTYYSTSNGEDGYLESYKVNRVIDPIGAGDGFASGVLAGLLEGKSFKDAVDLGSVIGAMVVQTFGDIEGLPSQKEIKSYLQNNQDVMR